MALSEQSVNPSEAALGPAGCCEARSRLGPATPRPRFVPQMIETWMRDQDFVDPFAFGHGHAFYK